MFARGEISVVDRWLNRTAAGGFALQSLFADKDDRQRDLSLVEPVVWSFSGWPGGWAEAPGLS
jgi:hypothetical protein